MTRIASLLDAVGAVQQPGMLLAEPKSLGHGLLQQGPRRLEVAQLTVQQGQACRGLTERELGLWCKLAAGPIQELFQILSSPLPVVAVCTS